MDSTALNLKNCETQLYPIAITPTIPVRSTHRSTQRPFGGGLPKLSFHTPKEAVILQGCEVELKLGIESVHIVVKAACLQSRQVSEGLKPIIPHISYPNSDFWNHDIGLPTIWVIIIFLFLSPLFFFFFFFVIQQYDTIFFFICLSPLNKAKNCQVAVHQNL